jgi:hypothetical protein
MSLPVRPHGDTPSSQEGTDDGVSACVNSEPYLEFLPEEPEDTLLRESVFIIEPVSSAPSRDVAQRWPQDPLLDGQKVSAALVALRRGAAATLLARTRLTSSIRSIEPAVRSLLERGGASLHALVRTVRPSSQRPLMRVSLSMPDISHALVRVPSVTLVAFSGGAAVGAFIMWLAGVLLATPRPTEPRVTLLSGVAELGPASDDRAAIVYPAAFVTKPSPQQETEPAPVSAAVGAISTALTVTSAPAGAWVTVDGIGWGPTPVTIHHLPSGQKVIRLTKEGYESQQRIISLPDDRRSAAVRVTLRSRN